MSKVHKTSTYQKQILINELLASAKSKLSSRIILQNKLIIIVCLFFWPLATVLATDLVDLLGKWWQVTPTALNTSTSISANINDLANQDFQHKLCVLSFNLLPPLAMSSPLFVLILGVHLLQKFHHLRRIWRPCYVHEVLHGHYTWGPQHFGPKKATSQCRWVQVTGIEQNITTQMHTQQLAFVGARLILCDQIR